MTGAEVECIDKERKALLLFKAALGDNDGLYTWSSWGHKLNKKDCCEWEGVRCSNRTGRVLKLDLHGDSIQPFLRGKISASLVELQYLMHFNLSFNQFYDSHIPKYFGLLTNLKYLDLRDCGLSNRIPSQLGHLSHLQYLDLSFNYMKGPIIYQLGNLSQLKYLDLSMSDLQEAIPYQLANLLQLKYLDLSMSGVEGAIPYQLGDLSQLQHLDLSENNLKGAIPYQLRNLSNLQRIFLDGNEALKIDQENGSEGEWLSGLTSLTHLKLGFITDLKYSHKWLQMIGILPNLKEVSLSNIGLSYQYILSLPSFKFNSSSLSKFDLSGNSFMSPAIFHWILNVSHNLVELDLYGNNFLEDPIPYNFGSIMSSLENLDLGSNNLTITSWSMMDVSEEPNALLMWKEELGMLVEMVSLNLSRNQLDGEIPSEIGRLKSLDSLDLSRNHFSRQIPFNLTQIDYLVVLDLSHNILSGKIPIGTQL
ncbi:LRR receptor-like serine/threonine-protein kinase RGI5 [Prosopis cineraria]|uniref:LRR receptor-like serine/threonine-protein kinase RGI5 n=1 Tax=Prosopis cineraria TaxID=364024 RepID=UPI00240ED282|nr:LRR receptor-like serine/threonine-protein kinase RGI5 [Prosopis cineraria]